MAADVAMVDDELGQALLLNNRGLCYAVLPNHVSAERDRISLAVPTPALSGGAEIFWRDSDNDLAVAYVEGAISQRCQISFEQLPRDLSSLLQTAETGLIKSVHFGGDFFDRIGAVIVDVDDNFISVRISDNGVDAEVMQGLSGAMLSISGTVVGIAIDAGSVRDARFLRADRIKSLVAAQILSGDQHPLNREIANTGFRVSDFEGGDKAGVIALEPGSQSAPWISSWSGTPIEFEITLSNDQMMPLNKLSMFASLSEEYTAPRRIELQLDRGLPGNPYWTAIGSPDMSPTGVYQVFTGGTMVRRVRVRIVDVWFPERKLRLDQLKVE